MSSPSALSFSTSYVNSNYLIKVYGRDPENRKVNKLVGVSGAIALVGVALFDKFIARAERDLNNDKTVCKLRRGIVFTLYRK